MIKAPLDEKNITTDWIQDVFDLANVVENGNQILGFIHDKPFIAEWNDNMLVWDSIGIADDAALDELESRLADYNDNDDCIEIRQERFPRSIMQLFFTKEEPTIEQMKREMYDI